MRDLMLQFSNNIFIEILMLAICADTLLGVLRAIKFRQFNSSVGIDGAIRKTGRENDRCHCQSHEAIHRHYL